MTASAARTVEQTRGKVPAEMRLAAGWTSFMLVYVYADILGLYLPGVIDDIQAGVVWQLRITRVWATSALLLIAIPIMMVVLSVLLRPRANRVTNLVVAGIYALISVGNAIGEAWIYFFATAAGIEMLILALIARTAWKLPPASARC